MNVSIYRYVCALLLAGTLSSVVHAGGIGTIQIPIRWCAMEGSSAAEAPDCVCEDSTKTVLWRRHERPSEAVYIPDCNVTWRSAAMQQQPSFPVIDDPCDPAVDGSCPGVTGDIFFVEALGNLDELNQAFIACYDAWDALGIGAVGVVGVNIRRFVNADGSPNLLAGFAGVPTFNNGASQLAEGAFSVIDNDFTWEPIGCTPPASCESEIAALDGDPSDQITGHEGGHSISLNHVAPPPATLMLDTLPVVEVLTSGGPGQNSETCPNPVPLPTSQCGQIRLQALCHIPGAVVSVPFKGGAPLQVVADEVPLTIGDSPAGETDLALLGLIDDAPVSKASFVWRTAGAFPDFAIDLAYSFAIDRDQNPNTGGAPTALGIGMSIQGVELVGQILLNVTRPSPEAPKEFTLLSRLWQFDGASFDRVDDLASDAADLQGIIDKLPPEEPGFALFGGRVSHDFDRGFLAGAEVVRIQARAENLVTGALDVSPEATLYLIAPTLPVCSLTPPTAFPGEQVTLTASGLTPNQNTVVYLGADTVATGTTDAGGLAETTFNVPALTAPGDHLITLGTQNPNDAITADCALTVLDGAIPGEPLDLLLQRVDTRIRLDWLSPGGSCSSEDYAVYAGNLATLRTVGYDHMPDTCSTEGATTFASAPPNRDEYYLVVDLTTTREGSYGRNARGVERPPSVDPCRPEQNTDTCR